MTKLGGWKGIASGLLTGPEILFARSYPRLQILPYPSPTRITEGARLETFLTRGAGAVSGARVSKGTRRFLGLPPGYRRRPVPKFGVSDASEGGWRKTAASRAVRTANTALKNIGQRPIARAPRFSLCRRSGGRSYWRLRRRPRICAYRAAGLSRRTAGEPRLMLPRRA